MPLDTRLELEKLESERKTIINSLAKLESQIYDFEGSYLKETGAYGNAVKVITEFSGRIPVKILTKDQTNLNRRSGHP